MTGQAARSAGVEAVRVLVVDDEASLARIVASYLEHEGYEVALAHDGLTAVDVAATFRPDVVILDIMLPGLDGMEVCRRLRQSSDCYIVMLTAREDEVDKVLALAMGADDYLVKPFGPRELIARIKAMLRRPRLNTMREGSRVVAIGGLRIDHESHEVHADGRAVDLTPTEFELLSTLASRPRAAFTRRKLIEAVWGRDWFGDDHVVDVHVGNLRKKLDDNPSEPRFVRTVRGVGYTMGPG
jgi:DNA-binding response OmpR family regulator